jgi:hypothetical protein
VTTANNDAINEANRINAQNAMSLTTSAYNNLMQRERDLYTFAFTASENSKERANQVTLSKMAGDAARKSAAGQAVGSLAASMIDGVFSLWS